MPASCARRRTAAKSSSVKRGFTDLSLRFISNRITWPPERSYSVRSAVATKSSASLSVLNVGIVFFIAVTRHRSLDRDLRRGGLDLAVVVGPTELQRPALRRHREEGDERVRRDGLMQVGAEDFGAVIRAHEQINDIARDRGTGFVAPISGFHDMRDQRLDLDDLAALCLGRNVDERAGHGQ